MLKNVNYFFNVDFSTSDISAHHSRSVPLNTLLIFANPVPGGLRTGDHVQYVRGNAEELQVCRVHLAGEHAGGWDHAVLPNLYRFAASASGLHSARRQNRRRVEIARSFPLPTWFEVALFTA